MQSILLTTLWMQVVLNSDVCEQLVAPVGKQSWLHVLRSLGGYRLQFYLALGCTRKLWKTAPRDGKPFPCFYMGIFSLSYRDSIKRRFGSVCLCACVLPPTTAGVPGCSINKGMIGREPPTGGMPLFCINNHLSWIDETALLRRGSEMCWRDASYVKPAISSP